MSDPLAGWHRWAAVRGLAPSTIRRYDRELSRLGPEIATLTTAELREHLYAREGAPATVAGTVAAWRSFYRYLVRTEVRTDDPSVGLDRPKVRAGLPRPVDDLDAVLARLDVTCQAIAVFLAETGLRLSEALAVDVDPTNVPGELLVKGKGSRERWVPLTELAREALAELGGRMPLAGRTIQRRFQVVGVTPHRFRHTLACDLANANVDLSVIQDILGHRSPATTRVYMANRKDRLRAGLDRRGTATNS